MSTDPRKINYPAHDDRDTNRANEETANKTENKPGVERRSGSGDDLKELDRAERRKK
jgi:hypothetical protein